MKQAILWLLAAVLSVDSILRFFRTSLNLGSFLMYCITAGVWIYALFNRQIDNFCSHGFGRVLKYGFFAGCAVFACMIVFLFVNGAKDTATGKEKALIVLGAGVRGTRITALLAQRLDAAVEYHCANPDALIVVSGGQGPGEDIPEAEAMAQYLMEKGVPEDKILLEKESSSTKENFEFSRELLAEHGISAETPIAYVTNGFHIYRAGCYARNAGFENVSSVSAPTSTGVWLQCYLREVLAVFYFWAFAY